jgi:hypothetical protein
LLSLYYFIIENGIPKQKISDTIKSVSDDVASCRQGPVLIETPATQSSGYQEVDSSVNTVVFIAKMVPVRIADLSPKDAEAAIRSIRSSREKESQSGEEGEATADVYDHSSENISNTEVFLALGRVFSGTLTADSSDSMYCLGNHHNPFEYKEKALEQSAEEPVGGADADSDSLVKTAGTQSVAQRVPLSSLSFYMCLGPSGW